MGLINVLDQSVANLIAAGEVVERPSSAVKEMVENSIDAGATSVTTEIKNGGLSFLRITDNGSGMSREDAMMCIRPHATSKIRNASDLASIMTLGFRGEALAAISAVTNMRIMTAKEGETSGSVVVCDYGHITDVSETGCPTGTTIVCESMFAHTPARLKFMKSNATETAYVLSVMERMAISRPDVAFKFIADGVLKFSTSGDGNLKNAIYSVFGSVATKMNAVEYSHAGIVVKGYISSPETVRGNRAMEHFFINSRAVKNKTLMSALEQAYRSYIPSDKFPLCVLDISLNHSLVDVNIHPSKLEVKFSDEKAVFDAVYYAIRGVLESSLMRPTLDTFSPSNTSAEKIKVVSAFVPSEKTEKYERTKIFDSYMDDKKEEENAASKVNIDISCEEDEKPVSENVIQNKAFDKNALLRSSSGFPDESLVEKILSENAKKNESSEKQDIKSDSKEVFFGINEEDSENTYASHENKSFVFQHDIFNNDAKAEFSYEKVSESEPVFPKIEVKDAEIPGKTANEIPEYTIIGELYATYIIMQLEDKIILVDKHAAHERINFEILRAGINEKNPNIQLLISPIESDISPEEAAYALEFEKEISDCGFTFEIKDGKKAVISGIPSGFDIPTATDMFVSLLSGLLENHENIELKRRSIFERALYQTACKASIKGGIAYDTDLVKYVCDNLLRYDCIKYCPHGRPVAFEITKRELDRRFGRIK